MLAWLLGEPTAALVLAEIERAEVLVTSELTCIECDRAGRRAEAMGELTAPARVRLQGVAERLWEQCHRLGFDTEISERARGSFPAEPIRTLDALHLAFLERAQRQASPLGLLSLDQRLRRAATGLGALVLP